MVTPRALIGFGLLFLAPAPQVPAQDPWAVAVESYSEGTLNPADGWILLYRDPASALGRPTVDTYKETDGLEDPPSVPVLPLYPAWDPVELVTVGQGGELILRMGQPIRNDPNHPYGVDFLVFGNSMLSPQGGGVYDVETNSPAGYTLANTLNVKPGVVAVSADKVTWYEFSAGPFVGGMLPTLGRLWTGTAWGAETDPTLPPDPALAPAQLQGMSLVHLLRCYRGGAGGTGFDLAKLTVPEGQTLPDSFIYVRIRCLDLSPVLYERTEIDAVTVVSPVSAFALWQREHFAWTQDPAAEAPAANGDGDADDNWREFAKGGNPVAPEVSLPPPRIAWTEEGGLRLDSGHPEAWQVEATSTPEVLESWAPVQVPEALGEGPRLYRLRLKESP